MDAFQGEGKKESVVEGEVAVLKGGWVLEGRGEGEIAADHWEIAGGQYGANFLHNA